MARLRPKRRMPAPTLPPAPPPVEPEDDGHSLEMTLLEHLDELRKRLTRAALALLIGVVLAFPLTGPALAYLQQPYGDRFQALDPTSPVLSFFRVGLLLGAIISIPFTTYQLLMFIVPGLTKRERSLLFRALPAITILFLIGVAFSWFVLIPPALNFLQNFQSDLFIAQWTADGYLGFITALIFWMGVAFETPLIFFVLSLLGMATPGALVRNWRIAVIGAAVAAAVITPTIDPVNMLLVMGPLLTLYALSIVLVAIGVRLSRGKASAT